MVLVPRAWLLPLLLLAGAPGPGPGHHLLRRVPLGGPVRWDYLTLDADRRWLFIAHDTEITVVDPDRLTVTGRGPDAIACDSVSRRVFTFNGGSNSATAIDAEKGTVAGTVPLGGRPEFAVADGRGRMFVNLEDRDSLLGFDTRTLAPVSRWPLAPCATPSALAMDRRRRLLFVGCRNRLLAVVNADRGSVLGTLPIGAGVDGLVFDPATRQVLSASGDGTLTVAQPDADGRYRVAATVPTARGARTLAFDPRTRRVFLVTADFAPVPRRARPRAAPGTFALLVYGPGADR